VTVTDQSGFVKAAYQYDPWGTVQSRADLLGRENKYKFIGEAEDPAASLMFLRARFLDSTSGRFLSRDPLGLRNLSGMSSYTYALANPLRLVDPSGLSAVDWDQAPATSDSTPNPTPFAGNAVSGAGIFQDPAVGPAFRAQLKSIVVGEFLGDYINFARDSYTWEKDAFSSSTPTAKRLTDSWDVLSDIAGIAGHDTVGLFMDAIKLAATPEVAK
jgi:RHS repeat-associated protein